MPIPLAVIAGEALGAVVVPMLIEAFTGPKGPNPQQLEQIKSIIERESVSRATQKGIGLEAARAEIKAELGPALEKGFTEEPGFLQSLLTWGGGGIAGALGGRKLGMAAARGGILGAGQKAKMATYDTLEGLAKNPTGLSSALPNAKRAPDAPTLAQPAPAQPTPTTGQRLLEREPDLGAETYNDFANVDEILGAPAQSLVKPGAADKLAAMRRPRASKPAPAPAAAAPVATADPAAAAAAKTLESDTVTAADLATLKGGAPAPAGRPMSARDRALAAQEAEAESDRVALVARLRGLRATA